MSRCRYCGEPVEWAITEATGRSICLDLGANVKGNLLPVGFTMGDTLVVKYVEPESDPAARVPHVATCAKPPRRKR